MSKILLVEPSFPYPNKSKNHKNFFPIGLLKIASYYRYHGNSVFLVRGNKKKNELKKFQKKYTYKSLREEKINKYYKLKILREKFLKNFKKNRFKIISKIKNDKSFLEFKCYIPDKILITSLFTYWSSYVKDSVDHYRKLFPNAEIIVGGIYASLMPEHCRQYTQCDSVFKGVHKEAEKFPPMYSLIEGYNGDSIDFQIVHTSRGCPRKCKFCGTWIVEPKFEYKKSIFNEIIKRKIIFYDNNLLMNPNIENILNELIKLRKQKKILWCESQSGFDGRILLDKPYLANLIYEAGFRYPRIAWDWGIEKSNNIKKQIDILVNGGYNYSEIFVFMIYNWDITFEEMEKKRIKCWEWKVQISDCRYRPLNQTFDNYNPYSKRTQNTKEYYIHEERNWSDQLIRQFRRNIRRQNICIRQNVDFYSTVFERKKAEKNQIQKTKKMNKLEIKNYMKKLGFDYWFPDEINYPINYSNKIKQTIIA